jgi:hypothetical protein
MIVRYAKPWLVLSITIVNVMPCHNLERQFEDSIVLIYDRNMFIIQATGYIITKPSFKGF